MNKTIFIIVLLFSFNTLAITTPANVTELVKSTSIKNLSDFKDTITIDIHVVENVISTNGNPTYKDASMVIAQSPKQSLTLSKILNNNDNVAQKIGYSLLDVIEKKSLLEQGVTQKITQGINLSYSLDVLSFDVGYLNDVSPQSNESSVFLESTLTVFSMANFNLALQGRIENINNKDDGRFLTNAIIYSGESSTNRSLSVIGTYLFNDTWAVTGAVISSQFDDELTKRLLNNQGSNNMAIIGTTYSF